MSFPSLGEIVTFIFRHDLWQKEQEVREFHRMVETMARHHHVQDIPRVKWLLGNSDEMFERLQQHRLVWRFWLLLELDIERLVRIDHNSKRIDLPEQQLGRFIPVQELFDHATRWHGEAESITVDNSGMRVITDLGYTVLMPNCDIYLGRLAEDGLRYQNAAILTQHVTGGAVQLDWKELAGKTDHIVVERDSDGWKVDTGLSVMT